MATNFTPHSAGQTITSADINLIQTAVNALENAASPQLPGEAWQYGYALAVGCGCGPVRDVTSSTTFASGSALVGYFRAPSSFTSTTVKVAVGATAAGSTTVGRVGLYSVNAATGGLVAQLATTANDTTFWNTASATKSKSWQASVAVTAGTWYALVLVFTGTGTPNCSVIGGIPVAAQAAAVSSLPFYSAFYTGQTDLPSAPSSPTGTQPGHPWGEIS